MTKVIFIMMALICSYLDSAEFVLFTQPKTGTHLLIPILTELTGKNVYWAKEYVANSKSDRAKFYDTLTDTEYVVFAMAREPWKGAVMDEVWSINKNQGTFLHLHAPYSVRMEKYLLERNCVSFFVKRDPRDQVVSLLNHYKHINFNDKEVEAIATDDERLLYMIETDLRNQTISFMKWLKSPACCVLDFEKLMGAHGGVATDADVIEEMRKIATALQLDISDARLQGIHAKHFGHGWSFFKGKVGAWKDWFKEEHKIAVKTQIGDLLIELGYENDFNW